MPWPALAPDTTEWDIVAAILMMAHNPDPGAHCSVLCCILDLGSGIHILSYEGPTRGTRIKVCLMQHFIREVLQLDLLHSLDTSSASFIPFMRL